LKNVLPNIVICICEEEKLCSIKLRLLYLICGGGPTELGASSGFLRKCVCYSLDVHLYVCMYVCGWHFFQFLLNLCMFCVQIHIFRNMVLTHKTVKNRYCFRKKNKNCRWRRTLWAKNK